MREPCPLITDSDWEVVLRKGATDEEIEVTLRDLFFWSYIVRDPLGRVCAVGRGTRADCVRNAFVLADTFAADELATVEDVQDEIRALNGPWRLVLWPPRLDADPPFWAASSDPFDDR
jgi:hypothetical protein